MPLLLEHRDEGTGVPHTVGKANRALLDIELESLRGYECKECKGV